jgi:hypothetical protein
MRTIITTPHGEIALLDKEDEKLVAPGGPRNHPPRATRSIRRHEQLRARFDEHNPDMPKALGLAPRALAAQSLPETFSWRDKGILTPVKHQGSGDGHGTCWAFASTAALEASYFMRHREIVDLSEQDLINCNCRPCNASYNTPGWEGAGEKFIRTGITTEELLPYHGDGCVNDQRNCTDAWVKEHCGKCNKEVVYPYRAEEWGYADPAVGLGKAGVDAIKRALLEHGPVVTKMAIPNGSGFSRLDAGTTFKETVPIIVGDDPKTSQVEKKNYGAHIVLIVGWDDNRNAWQIRNSWGTGWADHGYGWIDYNSNYIGGEAWWLRASAPEFRVTAVWRKGTEDERQIYGWSYDHYRDYYDRIWKEGWRLHLLETAVSEGQVEYSAVWRKSTAAEKQVYGYTYADYRAKYDELWKDGWRLHILSNYVVNGQVRYTAVWRKEGVVAETQAYSWEYDAYRAKYDELWKKGWRLHILNNYVVDGKVLYTAVWRQQQGAVGELQVYGATYADFRAKYDNYWKDGWRLHILNNYVMNGQVRYTAVWRKSTEPEVQVYSWTYDDFRAKGAEYCAAGWRLKIVNTYDITG